MKSKGIDLARRPSNHVFVVSGLLCVLAIIMLPNHTTHSRFLPRRKEEASQLQVALEEGGDTAIRRIHPMEDGEVEKRHTEQSRARTKQ